VAEFSFELYVYGLIEKVWMLLISPFPKSFQANFIALQSNKPEDYSSNLSYKEAKTFRRVACKTYVLVIVGLGRMNN